MRFQPQRRFKFEKLTQETVAFFRMTAIIESGLIGKLMEKYSPNNKESFKFSLGKGYATLDDMQGAFWLLMFGLSVAVVTLTLEIMHKNCSESFMLRWGFLVSRSKQLLEKRFGIGQWKNAQSWLKKKNQFGRKFLVCAESVWQNQHKIKD